MYNNDAALDEFEDMLAEGNNADVFAVMMVLFAILSFICLVCGILSLVATWKIFKKMGEPGWKALIPFYSTYVMYKHIWKGLYGILIMVMSVISGILFQAGAMQMKGTGAGPGQITDVGAALIIAGALILVVAIVLSIIGTIKLAQSFGKGVGFVIGLLLFPLIFSLILGFGSDRYIGNPSERSPS